MDNRAISAIVTLVASLTLLSSSFQARAQDTGKSDEVGIVYYAEQGVFKPLSKEIAVQSGRSQYSAKVHGAHAAIRLPANQPQVFRVCSVDASRFKLYRFKTEANDRALVIAKINVWVGGSKTVAQQSEIPVAIKTAEGGCFALTPQATLEDGEYGFSPDGSYDAFMFGVGDVQRSK